MKPIFKNQMGQVLTEFMLSIVVVLMLFLTSFKMIKEARSQLKYQRHPNKQTRSQ